jgi:hypothetical protein
MCTALLMYLACMDVCMDGFMDACTCVYVGKMPALGITRRMSRSCLRIYPPHPHVLRTVAMYVPTVPM